MTKQNGVQPLSWFEMRNHVMTVQRRLASHTGALVDALEDNEVDGALERITLIDGLIRHHMVEFQTFGDCAEASIGLLPRDNKLCDVGEGVIAALLACEAHLGELRGVYRLLIEWAIQSDDLKVLERGARYLCDLDELERDLHPLRLRVQHPREGRGGREQTWTAIQRRIECDRAGERSPS